MTIMPERQPKKKAISICHFRFHLGRLWLFWDWDFFLVLLFRERFCVFSPASKFRWNFFRFAEIVAMKWLSGKVQKKRRSSNENSACCHVCSRFSPRTSRRDMKAGNVLKETERSSLLYGNPESAQGDKTISELLSGPVDVTSYSRELQFGIESFYKAHRDGTNSISPRKFLSNFFLPLALIDLVN